MEDYIRELPVSADSLSEAEICARLEQRLETLFRKDCEAFFALLYRLDISEEKVRAVFRSEAAMSGIAELVYQRQIQKARLREQRSHRPFRVDDPDLNW